MTDDSKKTISIPSGDVLVAEEKPVLIDEDKVPPQDELQEISVSDSPFRKPMRTPRSQEMT